MESFDTVSTSSSTSNESDDSKQYKKVSHIDHVFKIAPDTYVGSVEPEIMLRSVLDTTTEPYNIIQKNVTITPALFKIFDEVLVNATDHYQRLQQHSKLGKNIQYQVDTLNVSFNIDNNQIIIENNGDGIELYPLEDYDNIYPPELIFGQLLTGSNYDQTEEKTWGGKNGYGAKLANIFSVEFIVETCDPNRNLYFYQKYTNNMKSKETAIIKPYKGKPYTKISFIPDYNRLGLKGLDSDHLDLFKARVYDTSFWLGKNVNVYLDNTHIKVDNFIDYAKLYFKDPTREFFYEKINNRFEIVATYSNDDSFQQVSFVNGINTYRGGKHVDLLLEQIRDGMVEQIKKKRKTDIKPTLIKNQLYLFVRATIVNPAFDSQTKETLTTSKRNFGSKPQISSKFIDTIYKSEITEKIIKEMEYKNNKSVKKNDGKMSKKIIGLPKLCDATAAGGKHTSYKCTLILTEGDSAKTTAVAGLSVIGRQHWGVFPLKGKLLNVKDLDHKKLSKNEEINNIVKILGLKYNTDYSKCNSTNWPLRYGKILIMTDQDHDGSHIKGLIMNLFHTLWPSLLNKDFITTMVTPIVKATKIRKPHQEKKFYNLTEYNNWKIDASTNIKQWNIKYYKGLGTSTTNEAKGYFKDLQIQYFKFDESTTNTSLDLAFDKKMAKQRKNWIQDYDIDSVLDSNDNQIQYSDFINKELIHFSCADCKRSIPDIRDGLKPSQRKVLFTCFIKNIMKDIKVSQLAGSVSERSSYHHGEVSLHGTIINLAQDFIGTNNINLLFPSGQFGSRLKGGKDASSPRYIFTRLSKITRFIFRVEDDPILNYLDDDGFEIEPETYYPIIPMILVNGTKGIGTGYSTNIPCHSPIEIIDCILNRLKGNSTANLKPWYSNFTGEIESVKDSYISRGNIKVVGTYAIEINELPIGVWTENYKEYLDTCIKDKINDCNKSKQFIKTFEDNSTESKVCFRIKLLEPYSSYTDKRLETLLKIKSSRDTDIKNMVLYDSNNLLRKFQNTNEIIDEFFTSRFEIYVERRQYRLKQLELEKNILEDKVKFINSQINNTIDIKNKPESEIELLLETLGVRKLIGEPLSFNYLINMPIRSLSKEKITQLTEQYNNKNKELEILQGKTVKQIWKSELLELKKELIKLSQTT